VDTANVPPAGGWPLGSVAIYSRDLTLIQTPALVFNITVFAYDKFYDYTGSSWFTVTMLNGVGVAT
jgi:hypothetical protein